MINLCLIFNRNIWIYYGNVLVCWGGEGVISRPGNTNMSLTTSLVQFCTYL